MFSLYKYRNYSSTYAALELFNLIISLMIGQRNFKVAIPYHCYHYYYHHYYEKASFKTQSDYL